MECTGQSAGSAGEVAREGREGEPGGVGLEVAGRGVREGAVLDVRDDLFRRPKNFGPFQRVPVIAKAIFDRL